MKVDLFTPFVYYGDISQANGIQFPQRLFDPEAGKLSIDKGIAEATAAHKAGFDRLTFAEHHYSAVQMTPAPMLVAAAIGRLLPDAEVSILGIDLPLHNPVNIAEQIASLDNIVGGRLNYALLRGTPNEHATYGQNPWESRARFEEAVELVVRCLTEPEPFGWEGRYYRFRNIAIFPGITQSRPRLMLSGNSEGTARFAGRMGADLGISFLPAASAAKNVRAYYEAAEEAGWTPSPENILYRQFAYLGDTDDKAWDEADDLGFPGISAPSPMFAAIMGPLAAAMAGVPKGIVPDMSKAPALFGPVWVGTPETVRHQIEATADEAGFGRVELTLTGFGVVPHEKVLDNIAWAGESVLPGLHAHEVATVRTPALAAV
jgi:alkanesulfonate monooxygenase SsuD/methylene tetrahydromethanopterin reductase-like flavin-dependent oxidoreductase (luciferase family)